MVKVVFHIHRIYCQFLVSAFLIIFGFTNLASNAQNCIAPIYTASGWGFVKTDGNYLILPYYESVFQGDGFFFESFTLDGMIRVEKNDRYGYFNVYGKLVVPLEYKKARYFSGGYGAVRGKGKKWGFLDKQGKLVIEPQFHDVRWFREGWAGAATSNSDWGFIDTKGNWMIEPIYEQVWDMHNQVARVDIKKSGQNYINKQGELLLAEDAKRADEFVGSISWFLQQNDYYGFVNDRGEVVLASNKIVEKESFNENRCAVRDDRGLWGCIDTTGKVIIDFKYSSIRTFFGGRSIAVLDGKQILIDKNGDPILTKNYKRIKNFSNGMALVTYGSIEGNSPKWGFIDSLGNEVIKPIYETVKSFENGGLAPFKKGELWGYMNKDGEIVVEPKFSKVIRFDEGGIARVKLGNKWGTINSSGQFVSQPIYDRIFAYGCDLAVVEYGRKFSVIDREGNKVCDLPKYRMIEPYFSIQ